LLQANWRDAHPPGGPGGQIARERESPIRHLTVRPWPRTNKIPRDAEARRLESARRVRARAATGSRSHANAHGQSRETPFASSSRYRIKIRRAAFRQSQDWIRSASAPGTCESPRLMIRRCATAFISCSSPRLHPPMNVLLGGRGLRAARPFGAPVPPTWSGKRCSHAPDKFQQEIAIMVEGGQRGGRQTGRSSTGKIISDERPRGRMVKSLTSYSISFGRRRVARQPQPSAFDLNSKRHEPERAQR